MKIDRMSSRLISYVCSKSLEFEGQTNHSIISIIISIMIANIIISSCSSNSSMSMSMKMSMSVSVSMSTSMSMSMNMLIISIINMISSVYYVLPLSVLSLL